MEIQGYFYPGMRSVNGGAWCCPVTLADIMPDTGATTPPEPLGKIIPPSPEIVDCETGEIHPARPAMLAVRDDGSAELINAATIERWPQWLAEHAGEFFVAR